MSWEDLSKETRPMMVALGRGGRWECSLMCQTVGADELELEQDGGGGCTSLSSLKRIGLCTQNRSMQIRPRCTRHARAWGCSSLIPTSLHCGHRGWYAWCLYVVPGRACSCHSHRNGPASPPHWVWASAFCPFKFVPSLGSFSYSAFFLDVC